MRKTRILVANDPRSYREALAGTIQELRPEVEVCVVSPEKLNGALGAISPDLVICSKLTETIQDGVSVWIELYPDGESLAVVSVEGQHSEYNDLDLLSLLSYVDKAGDLTGAR